jgi:hypothetical protein
MFVTFSGVHGDVSALSSVRIKRWEALWGGFVYLEGTPAGTQSVLKFLRESADDLTETSEHLKGIYFISLLDRQSGTRHAFIDPNGLYHAFCSGSSVGTSFLELAAAERLGAKDIQPESLVEFFHFGALSFGTTFFSEIRRLNPEHIVRLSVDRKTTLVPRKLRDLSARPAHNFEQCLASFAGSVADEQLSLDLTGGIDSRLLAVTLQHLGLPFELALSGTEGNTDILIAQEVAEYLGRELHVTYHNVDNLEASLPKVFAACDGLFDVVRAHRPFQLHTDRRDRGVSLSLSAAGGELFKDFWWLQDFPWYARKVPNIERLYATRIVPVEPPHWYLTEGYRTLSEQYRRRFCDRLSKYAVRGNTQTYDHIYYELKMRDYAGRFLTNHMGLVRCYAPYLDREVAAIGYNLPRRIRTFNTFHRRTTTLYNPSVAIIGTTEGGMSVSSSWRRLLGDTPKYVHDKFSRLTRKLKQRLLKTGGTNDSPNNPELWTQARTLVKSRRSLDKLKDYGLIPGALQLNDLTSEHVGNILSLDLLFEHLAAARQAAVTDIDIRKLQRHIQGQMDDDYHQGQWAVQVRYSQH